MNQVHELRCAISAQGRVSYPDNLFPGWPPIGPARTSSSTPYRRIRRVLRVTTVAPLNATPFVDRPTSPVGKGLRTAVAKPRERKIEMVMHLPVA